MVGVDLRQLLRKLNPPCTQALEAAAGLAVSRSHYEVTIEHMLAKLQGDEQGDVAAIFRHFEVEPSRVQRSAARVIEGLRSGNTGKPVFSPLLVSWFEEAYLIGAVELGLARLRSGSLLLTLVAKPGRSSIEDDSEEFQKIRADELRRDFADICARSHENELPDEAGAASGRPGAAAAAAAGEEALSRFTVDLTAKAREGHMDPILGRDAEIRQMIDVLTRRRKNNPMMVGEAGVGKTAVVEGFALRVAQGDVPSSLRSVRVLNLDMGLLQAGAGVKGEFENRLKNVIQEVKASPVPTILFIDEAHTLIGAGGAQGTGDAANLLKPPLARGELRTIGATTYGEYKKYIEKDPALERRFQPITVEEPSIENGVTMLRGVKEKFETHHGVRVLDSAVEAAVELSDRYIAGRQLPDKGVDVLDTACARVSIGQSAKPGALDDLERRIANLDIAIQAIGKDQETALVERGDELAAFQAKRADLDAKRGELHARWTRELEQVDAIRQLQQELERAKQAAAATEPPPAPAEGAAELPPPRDPAVVREEILKAARTLEEMQGELPLVQLHVDEATVAHVVGDWTGIPVGNMMRDQIQSILALEDKLRERVVGQDHAMTAIAKRIRAAKTGLQSPSQPIGVFLLVGPSGVGKTETGLAIADQLFGGERFMVTINMSEFMEKHSVSRLIGSPPGYVGYGEGGVLTEAVRHRPYSVVLLDEVEKADPEVLNLFYQVFDKGTLSDGEGRVVDFKNTVILMTSNLATDVIMQACQADEPPGVDQMVELIRPSLQKHFKPALLGRMAVIPYFALGQEVLRLITHLKLGKVERRLADSHGIRFEVTPEARDALVARCTDPDSGARDLDHVIDQAILPRISQRLLEQMAEDALPTRLTLGAEDGEFTFVFAQD